MALLEAMGAGLPVVATRVSRGATHVRQAGQAIVPFPGAEDPLYGLSHPAPQAVAQFLPQGQGALAGSGQDAAESPRPRSFARRAL